MMYVEGEAVPGLEHAKLVFFGEGEVSGIAEFAETQKQLGGERFDSEDVIPIIGEEYLARPLTPTSSPNLFDHIRRIIPAGLITFGVARELAARQKKGGTHMDIILREWAAGHGPRFPFLGVSVENAYDENREIALEFVVERLGSRAITMSRQDYDLEITIR